MSCSALMDGDGGAFTNDGVGLLMNGGALVDGGVKPLMGGDLIPNSSKYITSCLNPYVLTCKNKSIHKIASFPAV